jgi:hypothetical protein
VKAYWGMEVWLHAFLTLALDGGEWSASRPGRFTPWGNASGTHWIGGWVGPKAGLDAVVKRKIPSPCQDWNPQTSSPLPRAISLSYPSSHHHHHHHHHVNSVVVLGMTVWRSINKVTVYGLDDQSSVPTTDGMPPFSTTSTPALMPTTLLSKGC